MSLPDVPDDAVELAFPVEDEQTGQVHFELLPGVHLKGRTYRLAGSPRFAYRVSRDDVVRAERDEDGRLTVKEVIRKGGNRTVRIFLDELRADSLDAAPILDALQQMGLTCEPVPPNLLTVVVPKQADLDEVAGSLARSGLTWEHADPSYDQVYPPQRADD